MEKTVKGAKTAFLYVDNFVDNVDNIKKYPYLLMKYAETFGYKGDIIEQNAA